MGKNVNGRGLNILGAIALVIMTAAAGTLLYLEFFG